MIFSCLIKKNTINPHQLAGKHLFGFTLIELLVTVTIMIVLSGIGVAAYNNFNEKRIVEKGAEELKTDLRAAQSRAVNNEKPADCADILSGWGVKRSNDDNSVYQIYYNCGDGDKIKNQVSLEDLNLTLTDFIVFFPALGGTNLTSSLSITISGFGKTKTIEIAPAGDIKITD